MAISIVSVSDIAGYISKTQSNTYAATAVAALMDGNGNFVCCYQSWIVNNIAYKFDSAVGSNLDSNVFCSFKFDPAILYEESFPVDLYDSTDQNSTGHPRSIDDWDGMVATTTDVTVTQTTGFNAGSIGSLSPVDTTTAAVNWPRPTKTGTTYETRNNTTGKTFCFWYFPRTETPDAFLYQICDNTEDSSTGGGNYTGVNIQRPSNRNNAFTVMMGNNGGTASSNRRSHLGVNDSLTLEEWQFVVVRMISGSGQGVTSNYVNITLASAGQGNRSQGNDGVSGSSGSYNGLPVYSSASGRALRFFNQRGGSSNLEDSIGQVWILPFGLDADDSKLDDMFDATVGGYQ
tara:strand:+ start:343 stop:1380 length:1038 start_codon:yes stop_codon:yes gene_type:complete